MKRLLGLAGIPTLEQVVYMAVVQFERLISVGGAVPLAVGAVAAYILPLRWGCGNGHDSSWPYPGGHNAR